MVSSEFLCRPLQVVDTTLRDGEQAPGVAFSVDEKKAIAGKLAAMGVTEIEAGTPSAGKDEMQAICEIVEMCLPSRITAWCRANPYDIDCAHACGVSAVHISLPVSGIHLQALGKDQRWLFGQFDKLIAGTVDVFDYVSLGFQDASRAEFDMLSRLADFAVSVGVKRIRLADTVGIWNPFQAYEAIRKMREHGTGIQIGFHGHNDLGMATANAIAAIKAGANSVDVTVNGLGERAGNAPLDEVVMAAQVSLGIDLGIDTRRLVELAVLVEEASGRTLSVDKPVIGKSAFLHESGIHIHAMLRDRSAYEPFDPAGVGQHKSDFVLGKHSGRSALRHVLFEQGLRFNDADELILLDLIRRCAVKDKNDVHLESSGRFCRTIL